MYVCNRYTSLLKKEKYALLIVVRHTIPLCFPKTNKTKTKAGYDTV